MVNRLILISFFLASLLLGSAFENASAEIIIDLDRKQVELGSSIKVTLYSIDSNKKITSIDFSPWEKEFSLITDYSISNSEDPRWPEKNVQVLRLKLYPRKVGVLALPSLKSGDSQTSISQITVVSKKTSPPVITFSNPAPLQRETFYLDIRVLTPKANARLELDSFTNQKGYIIEPLPFRRIKKASGQYQLNLRIAVLIPVSGKKTLQLPVLRYSVSGVLRKKFYLPDQTISVQPVAAYVPPTIPVSRVKIDYEPDKNLIWKIDSVYSLDIEVKANTLSPRFLPPVLRYLKSSSEIEFLPANIERKTIKTPTAITSIARYHVPLRILKSGYRTFPEINIHYLDPATATLGSKIFRLQSVLALNALLRFILSALALFIIAIVIFSTKNYILKHLLQRQYWTRAVRKLQQAENMLDIQQAITLFKKSRRQPQNTTIHQWCQQLLQQGFEPGAIENIDLKLNNLFYADRKTSVQESANTLLKALQKS